MPRLQILGLFLLIPPIFLVGCEVPTLPGPPAGLLGTERDSLNADLLGKCTPPACRISFNLTNAAAGRETGDSPDSPWEDVKPNDTTPWIHPMELPN